ncbi:hypothetical protein NEOLI_000258 [Neolecta irregularis DAH-3]|uniref:Uncharacterized protein n=1 Tax=Neolecta irregularis (strain DAH-3) TaxID=1198029 RepID=A0A1U7LJC9_NEOID|nr:hypothetical protein NEOLI_000258 [Neolecta irregularis DAH-3]|eukprot:OLL22631.1 hypothetical protein NEOLI_000258 [Neolecta irregularis DAH-3]
MTDLMMAKFEVNGSMREVIDGRRVCPQCEEARGSMMFEFWGLKKNTPCSMPKLKVRHFKTWFQGTIAVEPVISLVISWWKHWIWAISNLQISKPNE